LFNLPDEVTSDRFRRTAAARRQAETLLERQVFGVKRPLSSARRIRGSRGRVPMSGLASIGRVGTPDRSVPFVPPAVIMVITKTIAVGLNEILSADIRLRLSLCLVLGEV
jgi:hypothetical protein